jgi:hypothetical protein
MAKAFIGGRQCRVTVDPDLGESWAVTVVPPEHRPGDPEFAPAIAKLQGKDRAAVLKGGLEILQKAGRIERFELEPGDVPPAEPAEAPPAKT